MTDMTGKEALKLKPCPFCGGPATEEPESNGSGVFWIICDNVTDRRCGCEGPYRHSPEDAAEAWNRRAIAADFAALEARATTAEGELSPLEAAVLFAIADGEPVKQVARNLAKSHDTIDRALKAARDRFKVPSTTALVAFCIRKGILK